MLEKFNPGTMEYYAALKALTPAQLTEEWVEESVEQYDEMLGVLPPIRMKAGAFMVGECATHTDDGAIYDAHIEIDGHYFWRPALLQTFNPHQYTQEVRAKFYGTCHECGHPRDVYGMCTAPLSKAD